MQLLCFTAMISEDSDYTSDVGGYPSLQHPCYGVATLDDLDYYANDVNSYPGTPASQSIDQSVDL